MPIPSGVPTPVIATWCALSRLERLGFCRAVGIWLENACPLVRVPETAPFGLMAAVRMWLDCTWDKNELKLYARVDAPCVAKLCTAMIAAAVMANTNQGRRRGPEGVEGGRKSSGRGRDMRGSAGFLKLIAQRFL